LQSLPLVLALLMSIGRRFRPTYLVLAPARLASSGESSSTERSREASLRLEQIERRFKPSVRVKRSRFLRLTYLEGGRRLTG
jgi:hypothetical protein